MTLLKALQLNASLENLSGYVSQLHEGKPVQVSFKFSGDTRFQIASISRKISGYKETFSKAREEIIKQYGGPWESSVTNTDKDKAEQEIRALLEKEIEDIELTLPKKEILSDDNPIPPAAIESLLDYIK